MCLCVSDDLVCNNYLVYIHMCLCECQKCVLMCVFVLLLHLNSTHVCALVAKGGTWVNLSHIYVVKNLKTND